MRRPLALAKLHSGPNANKREVLSMTSDTFTGEEVQEDEGRWQSQERIADALAELSEATDAPTGVHTCAAFSPTDVDFESDTWMSCLVDVQGWLSFNDDLIETNPESFLDSLARNLGFETPSKGIENNAGALRLSDAALERLAERAENAARIRQVFVAELDSDGGTRKAASMVWATEWNDEDEAPDAIPLEPVSAHAEVWPISELTDTDLNLTPSYQRGDVWRTGDRQALIESVLRGIPLPSVILLKTGPATPHEVVDGKQRLTAILRFVGKHPNALTRVAEAADLHPEVGFKELFENNYPKFRLAWKRYMGEPLNTKREDEYYFPFKLRNEDKGVLVGETLEPLRGKYYTEIKDRTINVAEEEVQIERLFNRTVKYKVPVIEYTKASQRQIHEVFKLYNKQGMHLNAEEIRNAIFHDIELTRAILVAAGDASNRVNVPDIAPSLVRVPGILELGKALADYGFGESRYRRTKVLGWVIATLVNDSGGKLLPSTARHTDLLLEKIQREESHPLRDSARLADLFTLITKTVELHSAYVELWPESFRGDGKSGRWQDLQLVGSLVGIAVAVAGASDDVEHLIETNADRVRQSSLTEWKRPEKTQTRTQWDYIARIVTGIAEQLGVNITEASASTRERFGSSGIESLLASRIESNGD